jgi:acyl dehydratase
MGDDGFLRELSVRLRAPVIFGDITYTKGKVVGRRQEGAAGLVELEVWAENQRGEVTATGRALVELPRRER